MIHIRRLRLPPQRVKPSSRHHSVVRGTRNPGKPRAQIYWRFASQTRLRATAHGRLPNLAPVHSPVHASWLNQIEIYFSIVERKALIPTSFKEVEQRLLGFQDYSLANRAEKFAAAPVMILDGFKPTPVSVTTPMMTPTVTAPAPTPMAYFAPATNASSMSNRRPLPASSLSCAELSKIVCVKLCAATA
jgi:hypothetical protein